MPDPRLQIERYTARARAAPESPWFVPLADAHRAAGEFEVAQRILRAGLERHPGHVSARVLMAQVQLDMQSEDAAEASFARVLELDPENVVALRYRADRARRRGALERAYEILRLLLEVDPFDRDVQADLGLLSAALERRTQAAATEKIVPPASAARIVPPQPHAVPSIGAPEPSRSEAPAAANAAAFELPWLHAIPAPEPRAEQQASALEPPPIDLDRVRRGDEATARPASERGPFVSRAGESPAANRDAPAAGASSDSVTPIERALGSDWTWSRQDDRIAVTPHEPPVRGPIRSVEQRVWGSPAAEPAPPAPSPPLPTPNSPRPALTGTPPAARDSEDAFSTLTLARIYESQGYLEKALAIYDDLHRRFPEDAEIAAHLSALQRRLAGVGTDATNPAPLPQITTAPLDSEADAAVKWRLVDPANVRPGAVTERLRQATADVRDRERERRHTVIGSPPAAPDLAPPAALESPLNPSAPEDVSRGHADFQRFLHYVRSLKP